MLEGYMAIKHFLYSSGKKRQNRNELFEETCIKDQVFESADGPPWPWMTTVIMTSQSGIVGYAGSVFIGPKKTVETKLVEKNWKKREVK